MPSDPMDDRAPAGLRLRALLIGIPAIVLLSFITVYGDMVVMQVQIGILQFAPPAIGGLLILIGVNRAVRWAIGKRLLGSQDLFPIYVMMTIAVLMCSRGTIEKLIPPLIHANYYATEENKWMTLFGDYLPEWLVAFDPHGDLEQEVARNYHEGNAPVPWRLWLGPLLSWTGLLTLVYTTFLCLSVVLRRQWADNEKLVFPLVTLPLTIIDEKTATPFFRNKLTWIGAAIPAVIYLINGLHANIQAVPEIKLSWTLNQFLTQRPWSGMYTTRLQISFAAIGFFYFLSSDLLLSLWFFFLVTRLTDIIATQAGYDLMNMPQYPTRLYVGYQVAGAYFVLVIYLLYTGWPYFKKLLAAAFGRGRDLPPDGPNHEIIPYRMAVWGTVLGFLGSVAWCVATGMDVWLAVVELGIYLFVVALVLSRGVAEAGLLQTEASFRPIDIIKLARPQWSLGPRNLTMMAMLDTVLTRDLRGLLLSNFLDDQKMTKELDFRPRSLLVPIVVAIFVALAAGTYFFVTFSYDLGHITLYTYPRSNANWQFTEAATAMQQQQGTPLAAPVSFGIGTVVCSLLVLLRTQLVWWPLHPLAYAVSASWTLLVFWFSALLTWVIKGFILRSGGMRLYRQGMPLFLGFIMGTFASAFFWTLLVFFARINGHDLLAPSLGFD